ncbi:hypothetical protein FP2506_17174 [Fulvimarina pelagi HTCC2506]|uniref:Uncharacterized protein n=1 Tax=Fulvimarina pelagi HTCC2506 TaxID=314231 RepID=Q0G2J5_9HYPH|nr:hypothetical protein FP2506_17174 [Fulvimarina pelagi HTCC2506]
MLAEVKAFPVLLPTVCGLALFARSSTLVSPLRADNGDADIVAFGGTGFQRGLRGDLGQFGPLLAVTKAFSRSGTLN